MAAIRIALKDLTQRVRDRSAFLWGIVAPLGLAAIFSLLFGPVTNFEASFAVADLDRGDVGAGLVQQLEILEQEDIFTLEVVDTVVGAESWSRMDRWTQPSSSRPVSRRR